MLIPQDLKNLESYCRFWTVTYKLFTSRNCIVWGDSRKILLLLHQPAVRERAKLDSSVSKCQRTQENHGKSASNLG